MIFTSLRWRVGATIVLAASMAGSAVHAQASARASTKANAQPRAKSPPAAQPVTTAAGTSLDFANARLSDVIRTLGTMLGRTILTSDVPDVRVTFSTAAPVHAGELEGILESLLETYSLMLVPKGTVSQVMPNDKAPATGTLRTGFGFPDPPPLGLVTQLVPLK